MKRLRRAAVVTELADRLREAGSWCGETHLQKACYFLQQLLGVPLEYEFILYRYGPFSFELREELVEMRADGLLELRPAPPYGPGILATEASAELRSQFPKTLSRYGEAINYVAGRLGDKWVTDLESLATALYVHEEEKRDSVDSIASRMRELKPRISEEEAESAASELLRMLQQYLPSIEQA